MESFRGWHIKRFMQEDSMGSLDVPSASVSLNKLSSGLRTDLKRMEKDVSNEGGVDNKKALLVQFIKQAGYQDEGVKTAKQQLVDDFKWVLHHLTDISDESMPETDGESINI
jgi:adenylosuccinate lyase